MREIKFRAFLCSSQRLPNGITLGYEKYLRGIYEVIDLNITSEIVTLWSEKEQTSFEVSFRKVKIMQYTGIKDIHSDRVFEGDIVKIILSQGDKTRIGEVIYYEDNACFLVETTKGDYFTFMSEDIKSVEVLGNIYESKELLNA
ncbi:YopX family protein [Campylobacter concisus]|uniref:YopX family protein n=1 Tax=Campylobacter concisus TaxID=199 RepID=UPI000CD8A76D|nr:YopX family protein [Campylobacter concisus]